MLQRFTLHLAFSKHSPYREQREVCFANTPKPSEAAGTTAEVASTPNASSAVSAVQATTRELIFNEALIALELQDTQAVETFVREHEKILLAKLAREKLPDNPAELQEVLSRLRRQAQEVLSERTHDSGVLASYENTDYFQQKYDEHAGKPADGVYPNAFQIGGKIYFNREHPDFQISDDPAENEKNTAKRERAVRHELAHAGLVQTSFQEFMKDAQSAFVASQTWEPLQAELATIFGENSPSIAKTDDVIHEAIAIYMAESNLGVSEQPHRAVVELVERTMGSQPAFAAEVRRLDEQIVRKEFPRVATGLQASLEELRDADAWKKSLQEPSAFQGTLHSNAPEVEHAMHEHATHDVAEKMKEIHSPDDIIKNVALLDQRLEAAVKNKDGIIKLFHGEKKKQIEDAYNGYISSLKKMRGDLADALRVAQTLRDWNKLSIQKKANFAMQCNFKNKEKYAKLARGGQNASSIIEADQTSKKDREHVLQDMAADVMGMHETLETLEKFIGEVQKEQQDKTDAKHGKDEHGHEDGLFGWLQHNVFSSGPKVMWISILDIQKIWGIIKEAVVENYHDSQGPRTYDFAKNWNFWNPIQDKLKQQARSHNEKEVHSYKEYLQKEGFTYDELFGKPGSPKLFEANLHHVNRAKAILEYAADHAWLYNVDRFNGHDVYGFDFEGNFGARSFEELMEHNASKQKSESDNGYSKVNNHPEIWMIIDDMTHEFHKKNLWSVKGMMQRLQEKAKIAHCNTWAVTTLLRAMRKDPDVLKLMDIGMLDAIGTIGISQSAWSMTLFKTERHDIRKWQKGKMSFENPKEFLLAEVIIAIEKRAPEICKTSDKVMDEWVAKVLAGQTMSDDHGKPVSIYEDNTIFNRYREHYMQVTDTTPTNPGKTDPDFFNPGNGGSDLLLLGANETANILGHQSQGPWIAENLAINYITQVFMRDSELGLIDPKLQKQFRIDMRSKLRLYINTKVLAQAAACKSLSRYRTTKNPEISVNSSLKGKKEEEILHSIKDKNILEELKNREMLPNPEAYNVILKQASLEEFQSAKGSTT